MYNDEIILTTLAFLIGAIVVVVVVGFAIMIIIGIIGATINYLRDNVAGIIAGIVNLGLAILVMCVFLITASISGGIVFFIFHILLNASPELSMTFAVLPGIIVGLTASNGFCKTEFWKNNWTEGSSSGGSYGGGGCGRAESCY